jgi:integrase
MAAEGIRKRHTAKCRAVQSKRCRCAGSWEAWIYLRRESRKVYKSFPTEAEAKAWRADATKAAKLGALRTPTKLTLEQAAWLWLEGADRGAVRDRSGRPYKPSTIRGYRASLQLRVLPEFGAHRLDDLRDVDVLEFVDQLLGDGLAPGTIRNTLNPLQAIYRHAIRRKLLAVNPTANLDLPKSRGRRERIASAAEAVRLLEALPAAERALWATAFYAGLRRGELRALRWSDVDLGRSEIAVQRSWDQYEGSIDPKSETSARTIPILAVLRDYLVELKIDTGREGSELVFGRTPTEAFVASTVRNRARRAWKQANDRERKAAEREERKPDLLEPITLHECRHTFASLLIDANVNAKALSTFMGHSTIEMTYNQYGHLMPGSRDQARELVDRYLEAAVAEARVEAAAADPAPHLPQSATRPVRSPASAPAETDERKPRR